MNTDLLQNLEYGKVLWINCKIPNKSLQTFTVQNFYEKKTQLKQIYGYSEYSVNFECCRNEK